MNDDTFFQDLHPLKTTIKPTRSSTLKVWWQCDKGHEWEVAPKRKQGCPVCANKVVLKGYNDLETLHPELATQWHPTKNGDLTPESIFGNSRKVVWWKCSLQHEYSRSVHEKVKSNICPYCMNKQVLTGYNDLLTIKPEMAAQWHPTKNLPLTPSTVLAGSNSQMWWQCEQCQHEWVSKVQSKLDKKLCPKCQRNTGGELHAGFNDVETVASQVLPFWDADKNTGKPSESLASYDTKFWFRCDSDHSYQQTLRHYLLCAECSSLKFKFPELEHEWSPKNTKTFSEVAYSSSYRAIWECSNHHEWFAPVYNRTRATPSGCSECHSVTSKPEQELYDFIATFFPDAEQHNRSVLNGKELDVYIPSQKMAVEFNGLYWHSDRYRDKWYHQEKLNACMDEGIKLIQIWEDDWRDKQEIVKSLLLSKLHASVADKVYARNTHFTEVTFTEAELFLNENHIQGSATATKYYALTDKIGTVLALLLLKKENENVYLINRYATKVQVVGGFTKLLKHASQQLPEAEEFTTFSDNSISQGKLYSQNGFTKLYDLEPDYMYVKNGKRFHKFGYRKAHFKSDPSLMYDETFTEKQLAELNQIPRIWDSGKVKWSFKV